jgi:hypothetical protein
MPPAADRARGSVCACRRNVAWGHGTRGHFHSDDELGELARDAGFDDVTVTNDGGGQFLTARWDAGR